MMGALYALHMEAAKSPRFVGNINAVLRAYSTKELVEMLFDDAWDFDPHQASMYADQCGCLSCDCRYQLATSAGDFIRRLDTALAESIAYSQRQ